MNLLVWLVVGYFFGCTVLCWCCCKVAARADERARQMRSQRRTIVYRILQQDHHWFIRSDASKLRMHLLHRAYLEDAKSPRGQTKPACELLCEHVPGFLQRNPEESKPIRV